MTSTPLTTASANSTSNVMSTIPTTTSVSGQHATSRTHRQTATIDEWRHHRDRSPSAGSSRFSTKTDDAQPAVSRHVLTSMQDKEKWPQVTASTSAAAPSSTLPSASSQRPQFAPWLFGSFGHSQPHAPSVTESFMLPPNHMNGVPLWPGCLPPSLVAAAAAHQSICNLAAAATAGGTPAGLTVGGISPNIQPSRSVPPSLNGFMPFMPPPPHPASAAHIQHQPTPSMPFPLSSLFRAGLDIPPATMSGVLPPNTLLVPYPVPLPLPIPIPIPIPVPFDGRLLAKPESDAGRVDNRRSTSPMAVRPEVETNLTNKDSSSSPSLASQLLGDVTWSRYARRRQSPATRSSSSPLTYGLGLSQQTSAIDFSTSARPAARQSRRDDVISPRDDSRSVCSENSAVLPVKSEPPERRTPLTDGVVQLPAASSLPPLPYSARRSLILDAPPPPQSSLQRDPARDSSISDRPPYSSLTNDVTTGRKFGCKRRSSNSNAGGGGRLAIGATAGVAVGIGGVKTH